MAGDLMHTALHTLRAIFGMYLLGPTTCMPTHTLLTCCDMNLLAAPQRRSELTGQLMSSSTLLPSEGAAVLSDIVQRLRCVLSHTGSFS